MVVHAGDVLVVGAGERLLGLHHFDAIGHAGSETILRTRKVLIGQGDIFLRHVDLLFGRVEIKKCGAYVVVKLTTSVFRFGLPLPQSRFGLRDVALDPTAGK